MLRSMLSAPGWRTLLLAGAAVLMMEAVPAAQLDPTRLDVHAIAGQRLDAGRMAELRGGLRVGDSFQVTFGIEHAIVVDGVLQATSRFQWFSGTQPPTALGPVAATMSAVSPLLIAAAAQGSASNPALASVAKDGLVIVTGMQQGNPVTLVQNSTNNRVIQTISQINVDVSNLSLLREMRMTELLQRSLM